MSQRYRLPDGGRIDRTAALNFCFNGTALRGYAGDTLASALLANGIHLVGRSFKYHRPRGIYSAEYLDGPIPHRLSNRRARRGRGSTLMTEPRACF